MNLTLHVWRQKSATETGRFATYEAKDVSPDMSFLEMLDVVNEELTRKGEDPIAFDHDCREGICGTCSVVDQRPPARAAHAHDGVPAPHAQLRRRGHARDRAVARERVSGDQGPGRRPRPPSTASSPRAASSRWAPASAPDGNAIPVPKDDAEKAMDAAACIGCGACVAACPNASAMLFAASEGRAARSAAAGPAGAHADACGGWSRTMDAAGFGGCTNHGECEAACPKGIPLDVIARLNRDFLKASLLAGEERRSGDGAA